jgi:hypothetical protein
MNSIQSWREIGIGRPGNYGPPSGPILVSPRVGTWSMTGTILPSPFKDSIRVVPRPPLAKPSRWQRRVALNYNCMLSATAVVRDCGCQLHVVLFFNCKRSGNRHVVQIARCNPLQLSTTHLAHLSASVALRRHGCTKNLSLTRPLPARLKPKREVHLLLEVFFELGRGGEGGGGWEWWVGWVGVGWG